MGRCLNCVHFDVCDSDRHDKEWLYGDCCDFLHDNDAVKVVRCCDCKYCEVVIKDIIDEPAYFCTRLVGCIPVDPTDYCSRAKQKGGESDGATQT